MKISRFNPLNAVFNSKTLLLACCLQLSGCVLTKVITVPMRLGGAVVSVIPAVGNSVDETIDQAADGIDELPL